MGSDLPKPARRPEEEPISPVAAVHLPGLRLGELEAWLTQQGRERYRAKQILEWVFGKGVTAFTEMTNLSREFRDWLAQHATICTSRRVRQSASGDGTHKLLLGFADGAAAETVWIPEAERNTVCLSSQVGCPVGCRFCASGLRGVQRNLTAGEIVEQALHVQRLIREAAAPADARPPWPGALKKSGAAGRLSHIVLMGMGEPLANYAAVMQAIRILNAPWGLGIGARKITLSTVGLPKQIRQLAEEDLQLNLALSLHAPDETLRRELIPWGKVPIAELLDACDYYFRRTGREVTLEYVLLDGVNNRPEHAVQLARLARRLRCNVNLLRYNPVPGLPFVRPSAEAAHAFSQRLRAAGVNAHIRTSRGGDIEAACGQLRRAEEEGACPGLPGC